MSSFKKIYVFFKQNPISATWFTAIIALYHATCLNYVYFKQVLVILPLDSVNNIAFFLTMPIIIFCAVFALLNLCFFRWLIKIVSIILILVGASLTYFMSKFNILIDRGMLENALQTNLAESSSYISGSMIFTILCFGVIPALLICCVCIKKESFLPYFTKRMISFISPFIVAWIVSIFFFKYYAPFTRNNPEIIKYLLPSNYISAIISEIKYLQYQNTPWKQIGLDIKKDSNTPQKPVLLVMVLGETARSPNFSLYGYPKQTNPLLSKQDDLFIFQKTTSCGTYTAYSVPCLYSNMTHAQYDGRIALRQDNILDMLVRAHVQVEWLDNDSGCKEVCDRVPNRDLMKEYNDKNSPLCQNGICYDQVLLDELHNSLTQIKSDSVTTDHLIVLHTIGSHGPTYYERYPDSFKHFSPTCDTNEIDTCSKQALTNTYDNTILYTDYIVNNVIEQLKPLQKNYNVGMIYLSDHGESLGEDGIYLHGLPYAIAPKEQKEVPFVLWLSKPYQLALKLNANCLTQNATQNDYSHDSIFHTLLGLFFMQTKTYDANLDLLTPCQSFIGMKP